MNLDRKFSQTVGVRCVIGKPDIRPGTLVELTLIIPPTAYILFSYEAAT